MTHWYNKNELFINKQIRINKIIIFKVFIFLYGEKNKAFVNIFEL